jgi:hypothetical protein
VRKDKIDKIHSYFINYFFIFSNLNKFFMLLLQHLFFIKTGDKFVKWKIHTH